MLEVHDYSNRRGVLVPFLPAIYNLLKETAAKEPHSILEPPEHIVLWRQAMNKKLVEVHRRWLIVTDGPKLTGLMFYHFDKDKNINLDELRIDWAYRNNPTVFTLLHDRFINEPAVKKTAAVFAGANIKKEANQELLAAVGMDKPFEGGLEPLGSPVDAAAALKLRYTK
jgi:hypothetical protein